MRFTRLSAAVAALILCACGDSVSPVLLVQDSSPPSSDAAPLSRDAAVPVGDAAPTPSDAAVLPVPGDADVWRPEQPIVESTLTADDLAQIRAYVQREPVMHDGRYARPEEVVEMYRAMYRAESSVAAGGSFRRDYVAPLADPPSATTSVSALLARTTMDPSSVDRFARSFSARMSARLPASSSSPVATPLSTPPEVGFLYHDGTTTDPARAVHGVALDAVLRFSFTPSPITVAGAPYQEVVVNVRLGGAKVGVLPPPPGGWRTSLTGKVYNVHRSGLLTTSGRIVVLDTNTQPIDFSMGVWRDANLYIYQYSYNPFTGFTASLVHTVTLPRAPAVVPSPSNPTPWAIGQGIVFAGSIALLDADAIEGRDIAAHPRVAVTDNFNGIYEVNPNTGLFALRILDSGMVGGVRAGLIQGVGPDGPYEVITPPPPGTSGLGGIVGVYPGAHSIATTIIRNADGSVRHSLVCWSVSWANLPSGAPDTRGMGLHCIGSNDFTSGSIPPFAMTGDPALGGLSAPSYRLVVPGTAGLADLTDGLDTDRFGATNKLYWMRAPADAGNVGCSNRSALRRIDLETGVIQLVKCDANYFAWTNEVSSAPPFIGFPVSEIDPSIGQEYNNPNLNWQVFSGARPEIYFRSRMPTVIAPR